jgi:hypothetical protein
MPAIQLVGGECDGLTQSISSVTTRPNIYWAVPLTEDERVRSTKGAKARATLREQVATLAYSYFKTVRKEKVGWEYIYIRTPELDKDAEKLADSS